MTGIAISGNVGGDVAGGDITNTGNTGGGGNSDRLLLVILGIVLIIALAWGSREFNFSLWGISGETK
jgi:hypothetical protein